VSQALERIRQAARQRKEEQFTALFHHLTIDLLGDALDELRLIFYSWGIPARRKALILFEVRGSDRENVVPRFS